MIFTPDAYRDVLEIFIQTDRYRKSVRLFMDTCWQMYFVPAGKDLSEDEITQYAAEIVKRFLTEAPKENCQGFFVICCKDAAYDASHRPPKPSTLTSLLPTLADMSLDTIY